MDLDKLDNGEKVTAVTGTLLVLGLLVLPWHDIDLGFIGETRTAVESPNATWGWLALLLTGAIVVTLILRKLTEVELPDLPISWEDATFFASLVVVGLLLLKLVAETDFLGWGLWANLLLAIGMAVGGFLTRQEAQGGGADGSGTF